MAIPKQVTVTVERKPIRTEISHGRDGVLFIRHYTAEVLTNTQGEQIAIVDVQSAELKDEEITAGIRANVEAVIAPAAKKIDEAIPAVIAEI